MKRRCENPNMQNYKYYGAKGVRVCDAWHDFPTFKAWAESHGYVDGLSIDRIDSDGNYEPDNCRWITKSENSRLATEVIIDVDGEKHNIKGWAERLGVSRRALQYHMAGRGLSIEDWIRWRLYRIPPVLDDEDSNRGSRQWFGVWANAGKLLETVISVDGVEGNLYSWARLLGTSAGTVAGHLNGRGLPVDEWIRQRVRRPLLDEAA